MLALKSNRSLPTTARVALVFCLLTGTSVHAQALLIADINRGESSSVPTDLTVYDGLLYFSADNGIRGRELWYFDATNHEADLAVDILADGGSNPSDLIVYDERLFFTAEDGIDSRNQLWAYDSMTGEATHIAVINPFQEFVVYNDKLFFAAGDGAASLAYYDASTNEVASVGASSTFLGPGDIIVYDDRLFFRAYDSNMAVDWELWSYNDATGTAEMVTDINPSGDSYPSGLTVYGECLYFGARENGSNEELWRHCANTGETKLVADIAPGDFFGSLPRNLTVYDDRLFFSATPDFIGDAELWAYDAASVEASQIQDTLDVYEMVVFDGRLFFRGDSNGRDLFAFDAGANVIARVAEDLTPLSFAPYGDRLYFSGDFPGTGPFPQAFGRELWATAASITSTEPEAVWESPMLSAAYPNPANEAVTFSLTLLRTQDVRIAILDQLGREVRQIYQGPVQASTIRSFVVDTGALAAGLYIVRVESESFVGTRKLTVVR